MQKVRQRAEGGAHFSLLAVSEGARHVGGEPVFQRTGDEVYVPRLGGIGQEVGQYIEAQRFRNPRDRAGTCPARRVPNRLRPLAGHPLRRRGSTDRCGGRLRAHGGLRNAQVIADPAERGTGSPKRVDLTGMGSSLPVVWGSCLGMNEFRRSATR